LLTAPHVLSTGPGVRRVVPPTAITDGSEAGKLTPRVPSSHLAPVSPVAAKIVTPAATTAPRAPSRRVIVAASGAVGPVWCSHQPHEMDSAMTPRGVTASLATRSKPSIQPWAVFGAK